MGFKLKIKAPKISAPKISTPKFVSNIVGDVKKLGQANLDRMVGAATLDYGKVLNSMQTMAQTAGQMTNLVKRPGDMPDVAGQMQTTGTEPPSLAAVTEDQNDLQRKELGRRFASRQLFGGMSGMSSMGRSSSLLGF